MKVIVAVILAIGSASAIGSGPYLPSGWRPKGAAFYLPSEVQKPADNPIKETLETEALGSEGLREYGPPLDTLNIAQGLPDAITEQSFYVVDSSALQQQQVSEVSEQRSAAVQEVITDSQVADVESKNQYELDVTATYEAADKVETGSVTEQAEVVTEQVEVVTEKAKVVTEQAEVVTEQVEVVTEQADVVTEQARVVTEQAEVVTEQAEVVTEQAEVVTEQAEVAIEYVEVATEKAVIEVVADVKEVEATVVAVEEKLENIIVEEEKLGNIVQEEEKIAEVMETVGVRNIAEALLTIDNEIKAEQVQQSIESDGALKVTQEGSGLAQVPEGFLEYGPPGFREYGPPKGDDPLRSNFENEVRRRRFSPKFRSSQNKKH